MSSIDPTHDRVRRFIVENQPVRGYWVNLESAWRELRTHQHYPEPVQTLLGEALSAAVLLAATLKFEGTLTLQLQGDGAVRLLVAQCTHDFQVRAVARFEPADVLALGLAQLPDAEGFRRLVGVEGRVAVTVEATEREMRYQGIVPLTGGSLSECLETYFASSEQLPTRVRLAADDQRAVGLLVQRLPGPGGAIAEEDSPAAAAWTQAQRSLQAVEREELIKSSLPDLLTQRFGHHDLRLFKGTRVQFACRCSPGRVAGLLRSLGADEVRDVLREQGAVTVTCEFCQRPYRFDAVDVERLFAPSAPSEGPHSIH